VRIALVLLAVAAAVYVIVRFVQSRFDQETSEVGRTPAQRDPAAEEAYRRAVRERAERQRRGVEPEQTEQPAAPAAPAAEPTVVVEPEVFGHDRDFGTCHEAFVVESTSRPVDVIAAVRRANARFMLVDELGTEHPDWDAVDTASTAHGDDLYTPNYAADPKITPDGVEGYLDCKGGIEPAMGATLRRVLVEELSRLDRPARVRPRADG
jgi:hypothetical protein